MTFEQIMQSPTFTYFTILLLTIYIYREVFAKGERLPVLKRVGVYFTMAVGVVFLNFFQLKGLPIIQSMLVAVGMMLLLWLRRKLTKANESDSEGPSA